MNAPHPIRLFEPAYRELSFPGQIRPLRPPGHKDVARAPGPKVTICIAARSEDDNCFVTVSDQRIFYHADMAAADRAARKISSLATNWHVLSGDVGLAVQIIAEARRRLFGQEGKIRAEIAEAAVLGAYGKFQRERAFREKIALGYETIQEFREKGPKDLGPDLFEKMHGKLADFDIGVELVVCGFEDVDLGDFKLADLFRFWRIFSVTSPGVINDHKTDGFWAIGSGQIPALNSLTANRGRGFGSVEDTVYLLCEAKFCAEGSDGVGKATTVTVFGPNGKSVTLDDAVVDRLRAIWEEKAKSAVPDDVSDTLKGLFDSVNPITAP
jgi:hypothetical protein